MTSLSDIHLDVNSEKEKNRQHGFDLWQNFKQINNQMLAEKNLIKKQQLQKQSKSARETYKTWGKNIFKIINQH
jgi:hypothetical protein